jgi:HSP20 family molecular chaperone IbpA
MLVAVVGWGWVLAAAAAAAPVEPGPGAMLDVTVSETAEAVEVRVFLASDLDPGSVEVQLDDSQVVVVARDADGRRRRSRPVKVSAPLEEGDSRADYGPDGWLTVTVPKRVRSPGRPRNS